MNSCTQTIQQHTPGPWAAVKREGMAGRYHRWNIAADFYSKPGVTDGRDQVAEIVSGPDHADANARLIAAAPELLEALEWAMIHVDKHGTETYNENYKQARAAIRQNYSPIFELADNEACSATLQSFSTRENDITCQQKALAVCMGLGCEAALCAVHVEACPVCKQEFCSGCLENHQRCGPLPCRDWTGRSD